MPFHSMACLDMYNSEHKAGGSGGGQYCPPMNPRISFSNDFIDTQQILKQEIRSSSRDQSSSSSSSTTDFEFSVTNYSMMSADELFFKGRLLPFRDNINSVNNNHHQMQRTIRDELLNGDNEDEEELSLRPSKGRWKGLLGLRRSHIGSKKLDKNTGVYVDRVNAESRRPSFVHGEVHKSTSQEILSEGAQSCRDVEIGI